MPLVPRQTSLNEQGATLFVEVERDTVKNIGLRQAKWRKFYQASGGRMFVVCDNRACMRNIHCEIKYCLGIKPLVVSFTNLADLQTGKRGEKDGVWLDTKQKSKLIQLCYELNVCYKNGCYLAVTMLTRTVLNHVPPIFGYKKFEEVANNYPGTSFKKSMSHLQNSLRNIADAYLHLPIREKEILPNKTQVNFANDLDALLAEIARRLK